jgi:hypothetical protein
MNPQQKLSKAHTHLARAVSGCCMILKSCSSSKKRFTRYLDGPTHEVVDLAGFCNIIYWMAMIQASIGIGPKNFGRWDRDFLPLMVTLPSIEKAMPKIQELGICKNRLWNLVNLSERKESDLPDIMGALEPHALTLCHKQHDLCTPSKCQFAHMNSTKVEQLHKCPNPKECKEKEFAVDLLETALEVGGGTAWSCTSSRLSATNDPYIAISHVWSDGTGVGVKNVGSVNCCLFEYFARIAEILKCNAIWWDALSIPTTSKARSKALNKMHASYANAQYTVVHDRYLLDFEWKDDGSPCLAIVLSPWFTRGWTALELAMSKEVKVLYKGPDGATPVIKDLDKDILAPEPGSVSRAHWLASSLIRRLRKPIDNVGDLLAILKPRFTSWARDRTEIAELLAGVPDCDYTRGESEITRDILMYLGAIPYSCLLHGKPTMCDSGGFSWCAATLDDMPIDLSTDMRGGAHAKDDGLLDIDEDGAVEGYWWYRPVTRKDIKGKILKPYGNDLAVEVKINTALRYWKSCLLLRYGEKGLDAASLLRLFGLTAMAL